MLDDPAVLLNGARHIARHIDEGNEGDVEGVAEPYESSGLRGCVDVEQACEMVGLLGDEADGPPVKPGKPYDDVSSVHSMHFHEVAVVDDLQQDVHHVVGLVGVVRHRVEESAVLSIGVVLRAPARRFLHVILRQEAKQPTDLLYALMLRFPYELANAALGRVRLRTAKFVVGNDFARSRFHDIGPRNVELPNAANHHDEIGQSRRIDGPAGSRPKHSGYLGNDARIPHVPLEDGAVSSQAIDALLDTRPP